MRDEGHHENIEDFRGVLDIINHELKALTFLYLGGRPSTIYEVSERVNGFLKHGKLHVDDNNIYRYLLTIDEAGNGCLAERSGVAGKIRGTARAWSLTPLGEWLQPAVSFGMHFVPSRYGVSTWKVLGPMNSKYKRRSSYGRVDIIRSLACHDAQSVRQLSEHTGLSIHDAKCKLGDLSKVALGSGLYPEGLPMVKPVHGDTKPSGYVYQWTGKRYDPDDFRIHHTKTMDLARVFTQSSEGSFFWTSSLFPESGYSDPEKLRDGLKVLLRKGYVSRKAARDFMSYELTWDGKSYYEDCLDPIMGYASRDREYVGFVLSNQPSPDELMDAAKVGYLLRQS
ncbi:MAG: hypothetical protein JXC85_05670 [Candidatus Aenigmarchaeota archaeon]|nr:hypothetical protein [Candidatus Aenigmarchaeota archaeon]